jgi:hypothetical protein
LEGKPAAGDLAADARGGLGRMEASAAEGSGRRGGAAELVPEWEDLASVAFGAEGDQLFPHRDNSADQARAGEHDRSEAESEDGDDDLDIRFAEQRFAEANEAEKNSENNK